jgi:hypothetical protein
MSQNRPNPLNVGAFDARAFFEAVAVDRERACSLMRAQVPDDGPPSPRAQAFIDSGPDRPISFDSWSMEICL